jgi:hypothetical protein
MPALPFFSALAPAPMASQGAAPQGSSESTSTLTSQPISTQATSDSAMEGALDGEQEASFFQQFQMATEGQEVAASLPAFAQMSAEELDQDTEVNSELLTQGQTVQALESDDSILSPWATVQPLTKEALANGASTQAPTTANTAPVIAMSDLEKQRQAMPKYQVNEGQTIQPQALQAREASLQQTMVTQVTAEEAAPLVTMNPVASNKTMQPGLNSPVTEFTTEIDSETGGEAGLKLDLTAIDTDTETIEGELLDENIHEKPITLQPRETILKPVVANPVETLAGQQSDSFEAVQGSQTTQTSKTSALTENLQVKQAQESTEKTTAQFKVDVPPQNPQWNDQVAKRIGIMASEQLQTARIQLDPPELGALEVKIKVQHDQVSVAFASNHASVRDALESQAPRLRELLEQQGVELSDVSVSDQQKGQSQEQTDGDGFSGDSDSWQEEGFDESTVEIESDSLVDYFA